MHDLILPWGRYNMVMIRVIMMSPGWVSTSSWAAVMHAQTLVRHTIALPRRAAHPDSHHSRIQPKVHNSLPPSFFLSISSFPLQVLERGIFHGRQVTKVALRPVSGRRHQLRVHLLQTGHPIVGDTTYCGDASSPRMMLHARSLALPFPPGKGPGATVAVATPDPFVFVNGVLTLSPPPEGVGAAPALPPGPSS
jgi:hypothetical protein